MNQPFSVYLDLVRFLAAVLVYLWHSNQRFLIESILPASNYGHSSVIVFFVLSGFIIAFITDTRESKLVNYAASRISRVFSVAIPAVAITLALDSIGRDLYPAIYDYPYDQFAARISGSLLMVNEIWLLSITSFSNVPYWSVCYEWWYYVTFAMVMFFRPVPGIFFASLTVLAIGPKLVLLAPVWWMGVLLYRWKTLLRISPKWSLLLVLTSSMGIILFHWLGVTEIAGDWLKAQIGEDLFRSLTFSKWFFADYLLGFLVFLNFAGMRNLVATRGKMLLTFKRPIREIANYTFTLYLLHQPLFLFWAAVIQGNPKAPWFWLSVTCMTILSVVLVGHFTESRRHYLSAKLLVLFSRWAHVEPPKQIGS